MVIRGISSTPIGCPNCLLALRKAFIPIAGGSSRLATRPNHPRLGGRHPTSNRSFSTSEIRRSALPQQRQLENESSDYEADAEANLTRDDDEPFESTSSTPWYLQVESPQRRSNLLLERQQIPELPPDPPPLLKSMLEHIVIDLGLDDLLIFDLRKIDPPPALGANLMMILGTARSEKHLHVSADRFCKWLKREHKLSPYADGLLGRGELKLKLRRKARRARLLSNVGSSENKEVDDGLRTGWICVNVGTIDDGKGMTESFTGQEGYVGFGEEAGGARVVIQMLTEEKREELDLEGLWIKIQQRQERKDESILRAQEELLIPEEVGQSLYEEGSSSDFSSSVISRHSRRPTISLNHIRRYHRESASRTKGLEDVDKNNCKKLDPSGLEPIIRIPEDTSAVRKAGAASSHSRNIQLKERQCSFGDPSNLITLRALVNHLERLPSHDAIKALGHGALDINSTPFLASFYQFYPLFPKAAHWECRLAVVCHGINIGHEGYSKAHLRALAWEMQSSLVEIPTRVFSLIYKGFLTPNPHRTAKAGEGQPSIGPLTLGHAVETLEAMSFRGHDILSDEIRSDLLLGALRVNRYDGESSNQGPRRLKDLLNYISDKPLELNTELCILHECADQRKWSILEDFWRGFTRAMRPRPKELYLALFKRVAQRNNQAYVIRMLRERVPDMGREEPPVRFDKDLAEAIMDCLLVAEPNIKSMVMDESNHGREWVKLWRHCERILLEDTV